MWGLPGLRSFEQARVSEGNVLMINTIGQFEGISCNEGVHLMEHPADPGMDPFPSIYSTELLAESEARSGAQRVTFDQCTYDGLSRKPTTVTTTVVGADSLEAWCPGVSAQHVHQKSFGLDGTGGFHSRKLQTYPGKLNMAFAQRFCWSFEAMAAEDRGPGSSKKRAPLRPPPFCTSTVATTGLMGVALLNEKVEKGAPVILKEGQAAAYVHVDDGLLVSVPPPSLGSKPMSDVLLDAAVAELRLLGFVVNDIRPDGHTDKIVGFSPGVRRPTLELPANKLSLMWSAMGTTAAMKAVPVRLVATLLGMWVWAALVRREVLAVPFHIFAFVRAFEGIGGNVWWWPSALREWKAMRALLPTLWVDLGLPLASTIFASDAQGAGEVVGDHGGYGLVAASVDSDLALEVLAAGRQPKRTVIDLSGDVSKIKDPTRVFQRAVPYSSVPASLFSTAVWVPVGHGRWKFTDHITLGEARSVVKLLRILSQIPQCHQHHLIVLEDNMAVCGSAAKGRSSSYPLNAVLRVLCAFLVACRFRISLPWTDTHRMPADWLSRLIE